MPHDCTKRRTQTESSIAHLLRIAPINADLNSFRPKRQKMRAEIDQDNSMAKSPPAPDFCVSEPANTRVFIHVERKRGIMSRRDGIVKKRCAAFPRSKTHVRLRPLRRRLQLLHTVFEAFATGWDSFPRRFSRKAANMALARAGKRRCIRSMR